MHTIRIKQVDAFTQTPFTGNPAAVVLDADTLTDTEMLQIAREMNLSETAYVTKSENELADLRLRWFTPGQEVDLCGHATIATFHAIAEEGRFGVTPGETQTFMVETRSGNLTVDIDWQNEAPLLKFSLPVPAFKPFEAPDQLCEGLGLDKDLLDQRAVPMYGNNGYVYLCVKDAPTLYGLEPDRAILMQLHEKWGVTAVVPAVIPSAEHHWEMRFFAPALGVFEDPITGSANGPMALYLLENDLLEHKGTLSSFRGLQGTSMERPGTVYVQVRKNDGSCSELKIAGFAVSVMEATLTF